ARAPFSFGEHFNSVSLRSRRQRKVSHPTRAARVGCETLCSRPLRGLTSATSRANSLSNLSHDHHSIKALTNHTIWVLTNCDHRRSLPALFNARTIFMRRLAFALFLAVCSASVLRAQSTNASLTGRVTDPSRALIVAARVAAIRAGLNSRYETTTNETGEYH